jgi:hypothetical protein
MDDLQRINVKFFLDDPGSLTPEEAFKILNTWIPQTPDETLIDVADYSHVPDGPVTLLVGHEANYSIDDGQKRRGLIYARKQPLPGSLSERLHAALAAALTACLRLEEEPELQDRVSFRTDEFLLVANDRLRAPNFAATLTALQPQLDPVLSALYGNSTFTCERTSDPAERFAVLVKSDTSLDTAALLANLSN